MVAECILDEWEHAAHPAPLGRRQLAEATVGIALSPLAVGRGSLASEQ
jgi:hypothetical protein